MFEGLFVAFCTTIIFFTKSHKKLQKLKQMELDGGSFLLLAREVNTETNENNEVLIRIFLMRVQSYIFELNLKFQFIVVVKLTC